MVNGTEKAIIERAISDVFAIVAEKTDHSILKKTLWMVEVDVTSMLGLTKQVDWTFQGDAITLTVPALGCDRDKVLNCFENAMEQIRRDSLFCKSAGSVPLANPNPIQLFGGRKADLVHHVPGNRVGPLSTTAFGLCTSRHASSFSNSEVWRILGMATYFLHKMGLFFGES